MSIGSVIRTEGPYHEAWRRVHGSPMMLPREYPARRWNDKPATYLEILGSHDGFKASLYTTIRLKGEVFVRHLSQTWANLDFLITTKPVEGGMQVRR